MEKIDLDYIYIYGKKIFSIKNKKHFLEKIIFQKKILVAMNARKIITSDEKLKKIINNNISYPDGKSVVMALSQKGIETKKYPGFILWHDLVKKYHKDKTFYLIGSEEKVIQETILKLKNEFKNINILGFHNGYLDEDIKRNIENDIVEKKPDIVFVAMGTPVQEYFMNELIKKHKALYLGLGGSFDVYVGNVKSVPWWWEKFIGHEGLYRVLQDPKKIKRQMNVINFLILYYRNKL
jgi:UDP-N-acetyl-D-mannosaminouronate:lipid I N-acetyl-D-mannosaminouronosyltransferase